MSLDIYLIRHGESEINLMQHHWAWNEKVICGANPWSELTEEGIENSKELGQYFRKNETVFDIIYSSPAVRAQQTARHCLQAMDYGWPIYNIDSRLSELDQGRWEGNLDYKTRTDDVWDNIDAMNWHFTPPGGESQYDVYRRFEEFLEEEILDNSYENVLVFSHQNAIACLLTGIMGLDTRKIHEMYLHPTSMTILQYEGGELDRVNKGYFPHLWGGSFA